MTSKPMGKVWNRIGHRPIEDYSKLWLGVIGVGVITAMVAVTVVISSLGVGEVRYDAEFLQAAQIRSGDQVTVAGISVGTVAATRLEDDHVVVSMKIHGDVPLGDDTKAAIKLTTLLGSRYIELKPAGAGSIADHRIRLSNTAVPYDLQAALQNATTTFEQIDAEKIGQTMTILSNQLDGAPTLVPQALENIKNLSSVIAQRRDQIGSLLTSTSQVTTVISDQQASLGAMVTQARDVLQELVSRRETLERLLDATTNLVTQLQHIVVDDQPQVTELLTNLAGLMQMLGNHDDLLRNILQILPVPVRNLANATGSTNDLDFNGPAGILIDSWMCALSGRAQQVNMPPYLRDCK